MKKLMFPKERKLIALVLAFVLAIAGIGVYQAPNAIAAGKKKMAAEAVTGTLAKSAVRDARAATSGAVVETVGAEDKTTGFWGAHSRRYKIEDQKQYVFTFENHGDGVTAWNNYAMVFRNMDVDGRPDPDPGYVEYAVIRADQWGWGGGDNNSHKGTPIEFGGEFNADTVKDSNVVLTIKRSGGRVLTETVVTAIDDATKTYTRTADFDLDEADSETYFGFTVDHAYIKIKTMEESDLEEEIVQNVGMVLGAEQDAIFVMNDENITGDGITWTVADTSIAEIANGKITAKAVGETMITAVKGETTVTKKLIVTDSVDTSSGFFAGQSPETVIGEDGLYLTFRSQTIPTSVENCDAPVVKIFNGHHSYFVRSDLYGWDDALGIPAGGFFTTNLGTGVDWPSFQAENKAGVNCYISAVKVGENIRVRMTIGSLASETFIPIAEGGPLKVILSGEKCTMTNVRVVDKSNFNDPGPVIPIVPVYPGSVVTPKPIVTPGPEINVPITPSNVKVDQTVTGTEWWTGCVNSEDYAIPSGDGSMVMYVSATELNDAGYGAFSVEVQEGDKYFTTGSDHNAWIAKKATGSVPEQTIVDSHLIKDHVYRITVTRKGKDITVNYYDATDQKDYYEVTVSGSNFGEDTKVHLIAQVGTFGVGQEVNMDVDPSETVAPPEVTVAPPADVTTAPDVTAEPSSEPSKAPDVTTAPSTEPSAEPEPDDNKGAKTGSKVTVSGNTYKVNSGSKVTYTAKKKNTATVTVPATVKIKGKTYKVTAIGANAFKGNKSVKKITVSKNITKIGKSAFSGCKKLKTIVIKSKKLKASGIAKGAFKGITKKTVIKVPKGKKKAYQKMFRKKGLSKAVKVK